MSHFTVLVVGDDFEQQLEPYDENTEVEQYREPWSDFDVARFEEHYGVKVTAALPRVLRLMRDWNGGENGYDAEADEFYRLSTYNPLSRWDWYVVGGRWRGFFQARNGAEAELGSPGVFDNGPHFNADQLRKGDVDFEGMRAAAAAEAELAYTEYEEVIAGTPEPETWQSVLDKWGEKRINEARAEYGGQPRVKALEKAKMMPWGADPEEVYGGGREAFVQRAADSVAVPYAIVRDGEWYQRGEMGWWGIAHNEMPEADWNRKVQELYDELDDDELLTLCDCHI